MDSPPQSGKITAKARGETSLMTTPWPRLLPCTRRGDSSSRGIGSPVPVRRKYGLNGMCVCECGISRGGVNGEERRERRNST